jgi:deoxyribodipyrimidine photolyase-like uncharacterized protein
MMNFNYPSTSGCLTGNSQNRNLSTPQTPSTTNLVITDKQQQQQQQQNKRKKKQCRGNRKLQRFTTKLRKQGFDVETITTLINNYNNPSNQPNNEEEFTAHNIDVEVFIPPLQDQV